MPGSVAKSLVYNARICWLSMSVLDELSFRIRDSMRSKIRIEDAAPGDISSLLPKVLRHQCIVVCTWRKVLHAEPRYDAQRNNIPAYMHIVDDIVVRPLM